MAFTCEDFAAYGVVLVALSAANHQGLLSDIARRLAARPVGGPAIERDSLHHLNDGDERGAVLVNAADQAIVSLAYVRTVRDEHGRVAMDTDGKGASGG